MVLIRNRLAQPLVINLKNKESIHLMDREDKEIELEQLDSPEMKNHIERGNVLVIRLD